MPAAGLQRPALGLGPPGPHGPEEAMAVRQAVLCSLYFVGVWNISVCPFSKALSDPSGLPSPPRGWVVLLLFACFATRHPNAHL